MNYQVRSDVVTLVDRLKFLERIDLNDVFFEAFLNCDLVIILAVNKGNLLPVSLASAGCLEDVVDVL